MAGQERIPGVEVLGKGQGWGEHREGQQCCRCVQYTPTELWGAAVESARLKPVELPQCPSPCPPWLIIPQSHVPTLPFCHHHQPCLGPPSTAVTPLPCSQQRVPPMQCPQLRPHPEPGHRHGPGTNLPPPPTHMGGRAPRGWGVPGPQEAAKKEGKTCPPRRPAAAELLCRCLLSWQKRELNGPRCVAFPAALTGRSQKRGRRKRRRKGGRKGRAPLERGQ